MTGPHMLTRPSGFRQEVNNDPNYVSIVDLEKAGKTSIMASAELLARAVNRRPLRRTILSAAILADILTEREGTGIFKSEGTNSSRVTKELVEDEDKFWKGFSDIKTEANLLLYRQGYRKERLLFPQFYECGKDEHLLKLSYYIQMATYVMPRKCFDCGKTIWRWYDLRRFYGVDVCPKCFPKIVAKDRTARGDFKAVIKLLPKKPLAEILK